MYKDFVVLWEFCVIMLGYLVLSLCVCNGGYEENYKKGCVNLGYSLLIILYLGSFGKGEVVLSF